jgi:uncharacterized protein (TIGR00297 family)
MNIISFTSSLWIIVLMIIAAGFLSYVSGKLTLWASVAGVWVALLIYLGAGITGLLMLATFFVLGTVMTSYKKDYKLQLGLVKVHEGKRKTSQVLANAGVAAILALLIIIKGDKEGLLLMMIAGSLASATGDTLSSELGNLYGRNFYNILTFRKDKRGLDGVISAEGTLFGILGSMIIALIYTLAFSIGFAFLVIVIAGIFGNLFDSLLGALFERKDKLGNDAVNFLNTAFAALIAFLLLQL